MRMYCTIVSCLGAPARIQVSVTHLNKHKAQLASHHHRFPTAWNLGELRTSSSSGNYGRSVELTPPLSTCWFDINCLCSISSQLQSRNPCWCYMYTLLASFSAGNVLLPKSACGVLIALSSGVSRESLGSECSSNWWANTGISLSILRLAITHAADRPLHSKSTCRVLIALSSRISRETRGDECSSRWWGFIGSIVL